MEAVAQLAPFVVIALLFWLLLIRPAQRRQREVQQIQRSAEVGSEIMLTSGVFGTVAEDNDDTLQVEIAPGTVIKVARAAVARVVTAAPADAQPDSSSDQTDETATAAESVKPVDGE